MYRVIHRNFCNRCAACDQLFAQSGTRNVRPQQKESPSRDRILGAQCFNDRLGHVFGRLHIHTHSVIVQSSGSRRSDHDYAQRVEARRRDVQGAAKKAGRPWDMGKGFDASAPIGTLVPAAGFDPTRGAIELRVNGTTRQSSDLSQLIWSVAETIAILSTFVALAPGDLIYTGTPAGVAAVQRGDVLEGSVAGIGTVRTTIV